jgi:membrane-bound lytic murein transglycosylase B
MLRPYVCIAALTLSTACGRNVDGVLYSTDGGSNRLAAREVVAVPASRRTERALEQFCREQAKRGAESDSLRARLERRSVQLMSEAERERARNGWSSKWRQLVNQSDRVSDSARAVPYEALSSSRRVAQELAVAKATTNGKGEFHLTGVPFGKHLLVATADDDWGDVISVAMFRPTTKADLSTERALPGCVFGAGFRR